MELVRPFPDPMIGGANTKNTLGRDYGTTRGYANESEFTVVKVGMIPSFLFLSNSP